MTAQRFLLRLLRAGIFRGPALALLRRRTWTVEGGEGVGLKLSFPQNPDYILGSSELPVQRAFARYLRRGGVFYDVGANVGFFSLLAARFVGREGSVYCFEPVTENAATIRRNAELNSMKNISIFDVAVGCASGVSELHLSKWDGGASLSGSEAPTPKPVEVRSVPVVALDEIVSAKELRAPTLVKIDVEGAELGVIRGMLETISKFKPVVIYEVDDGNRASFERRWEVLDQLVKGLGYDVAHLEDSYPNLRWYVGHSVALPIGLPTTQ